VYLIIRQIEKEDEKLLEEFINSLSETTKSFWYYPFDIGERRVEPNARNIVKMRKDTLETRIAIEDCKILGLAFLISNSKHPRMPSISIVVRDEYQNRGIGTRLIKELQFFADQRYNGIYCGVLKKNTKALEFYKKNYFQIVGEKKSHGMDAYEMRWWDDVDYHRKIEKLAIVTSITDKDHYKRHLEKSFSKVGVPYSLIKTDPHLPYTISYNSILKYKNLKDSKYIVFVHQDVEFLEDNWGKKIFELCDNLPDFGYGGTECRTEDGIRIGCGYAFPSKKRWGKEVKVPTPIQTCDAGIAVIPTYLFLERQFDTSFLWYPVHEDYACWVQYVRGLKAYALPLITWHAGQGHCRWIDEHLYSKVPKEERNILEERYGRRIYTTGS